MDETSPSVYWRCPDGSATAYLYELAGRRAAWRARFVARAGGSQTAQRALREDAVEWLEELIRLHLAGATSSTPARPTTVAQLVEAFCERTQARSERPLSPATRRAYRSQLVGLLEVTRDGEVSLGALHAGHVRAALRRKGSPHSRAQWLRAMRALCRWGVEQGLLRADVTAGIVAYAPAPEGRRWLDAHEQRRVLDACAPATRVRVGLALATGLRRGELVALRWEWIAGDVGVRVLHIPAARAKAREARGVPLGEAAERALAEARALWPTGPLVLYAGAEERSDVSCWNRELQAAARSAGLTWEPSYHDLRRSAGMNWLRGGASLHTVSRLLGHSSASVTERWYVDAPDEQMLAAVRGADAAQASPVRDLRDHAKRRERGL